VQHLELEGVARDAFAGGEGLGLVDDGLVVGGETVVDTALHQGLHQLDVVGVDFGLFLEGDCFGLFVGSFAEADADAFVEEFFDISLGAAHVGLDDGSDAILVAGDAVKFVDEIEGALGVGGAFHIDANEIFRRHAGRFGDQTADNFVGHGFVDVEAHVGEFKADVGVEIFGGDLVEQVVVELSAGAGFIGVSDIFSEVVDGDAGSDLIHGGGGADGVGYFFSGNEAGGGALADAGALSDGAEGTALGESDEGGS